MVARFDKTKHLLKVNEHSNICPSTTIETTIFECRKHYDIYTYKGQNIASISLNGRHHHTCMLQVNNS